MRGTYDGDYFRPREINVDIYNERVMPISLHEYEEKVKLAQQNLEFERIYRDVNLNNFFHFFM